MRGPIYFASALSLAPAGPDGRRKLYISGYDSEPSLAIDIAPLLFSRDGFDQTQLPIERAARNVATRLRDMATVASVAGNDLLRNELLRTASLLEAAGPDAFSFDAPTPESMGMAAEVEANINTLAAE